MQWGCGVCQQPSALPVKPTWWLSCMPLGTSQVLPLQALCRVSTPPLPLRTQVLSQLELPCELMSTSRPAPAILSVPLIRLLSPCCGFEMREWVYVVLLTNFKSVLCAWSILGVSLLSCRRVHVSCASLPRHNLNDDHFRDNVGLKRVVKRMNHLTLACKYFPLDLR